MNLAARLRDLSLLSASTITIIGTTVIAASLPQMAEAFAGQAHAAFLVKIALTLPALAAGIAALSTGWAIERVGRKRLFVAALALYALAGAAGYALQSLPALLLSRFALGLSIAAIMTCATTLIADYAQRDGLGGALGRQSLFMALGNIVFVFLGGVLAGVHWRLPFLIYLVALAILPGVAWLVRDLPAAPAAGASQRPSLRTAAPICALGLANMLAYFMVPVYLPFHLRGFPDASSVRVGSLLALVGLAWGAASLAYPRAAARLRHGQVLALGFGLSGAGLLLLGGAGDYPQACLGLVAIGLGLGMNVPNFNAWMLSRTPAPARARAIGWLVCCVFLGQFFSPVLTQPLVAALGIGHAYLAAGAAALAVAAGALALSARTRQAAATQSPVPRSAP